MHPGSIPGEASTFDSARSSVARFIAVIASLRLPVGLGVRARRSGDRLARLHVERPAELVFEGATFSQGDRRTDYGETRIQTVGFLKGRTVMIVWTPRGGVRHIISMRKCNAKEQAYYRQRS